MKRTAVIVAMLMAGLTAFSGVAAGQDPTTTLPPDTTVPPPTTVAPPPTTDPPPPTTDPPPPPPTTLAPPTTDEPVILPGEWVQTGKVYMGTQFLDLYNETFDQVNPDCRMENDLDGNQQFNVVRDPTGIIQAAYGYGTFANGDEAGMVMIQLAPLPLAVGVYRTFGTCEQDGFAVGSYTATDTTALLIGSGMGGLVPYSLSKETYLRIDVSSSVEPPQLDLQAAQDYLAKPRG